VDLKELLMIKKRFSFLHIFVIIGLFILTISGIVISQSQSVVYNVDPISKSDLENIRALLKVECLQNSQCSNGYECINNNCIGGERINSCKDISLAPVSTPLFIGQSLNTYREAFTETNLPDLLSDGTIAVLENGNVTEYNYAQVIFSGSAKLRSQNGQVSLRATESPNDFFYKYKIYFSNGLDFSSRFVRGHSLRILGNEYVIGNDSTNSDLYLVSAERQIKLDNLRRIMVGQNEISGSDVSIDRDNNGNVISIEIIFNKGGVERQLVTVGDSYSDPIFNSSIISFNSYGDRASITIGGGGCR
jgi:uncharacterized protein YuzE